MTSQSVAEIVAETMNNYLLMGHLLKCQVGAQMCTVGEGAHVQIIPQDEVHEKLWEGANKKFRKVPRARVEKARHERVSTEHGSRARECADARPGPRRSRTSRTPRC